MDLINELHEEIYIQYKDNDLRAIGIRIHPDWYAKLVAEYNRAMLGDLDKNGNVTFRGLPLEQTEDVEKWELQFYE